MAVKKRIEKKKPGRKPKPEHLKHTYRVQVMLTPEDAAAIERLRGGEYESVWCAEAIRQRIARESK